MFKNTAAKFIVFAFDATTNVPKTGDAANITAYVSKDYGTVTVLADTSATEMDATNAPGYYLFDAAQGETNGDCLLVSAKSVTANIKVLGAPAAIYTRPTTGYLAPTTLGRTLVVDAAGLADANVVKVGPTGSGTAQTAGDIYPKVSGLTFTVANQVDVNVKDWAGTAVSVPTVAGVPNVNVKTWNDLATVALPLVPLTAGRTLDVTAANKVNGVVLVDTVTTYTGNTPQTGDNYARIGAAGAGLTSVALTSAYDFAKGTTAVTESYNADGSAPTPIQAIMAILQILTEGSVAGTTMTVKKLDGSTTAFTLTLNSGTAPTSISRTA